MTTPGGQPRSASRKPLTLRTRSGIALVLAAFILSLAFALVPSAFNSSTIAWNPDSSSDSGSLQLTRGAPERMSVRTTCELARTRTPDDPSMLTTGSLDLSVVDGEVRLQSSPDGPSAEVALPPGDCEIRATYTHDGSVLKLSVGDDRDEVAVAAPTILGLYTSDPPSVTSVDVTTQETGLAPSWGRWTVGLVALAALIVGAALLWLPVPRPRNQPLSVQALVPRLAPVDGFVAIVVFGMALVTPPLVDDGWIMNRSRQFQDRWWFGELFAVRDGWLPQGGMHELALAALQDAGLGLAQIRMLVALLLVVTWVVLRRGVISHVVGDPASRWAPAAATYLAFVGAWAITVRQEPPAMFLSVLALVVAVSADRSTRPGHVFLGLLAAGTALTTHQTGWVALAPAAVILWSVGLEIGRNRSRQLALILPVLAAASGCVLVAFAVSDVSTVIEGARTLSDGAHSLGPLDELARYDRLLAGPAARVVTALILLVWCLAGSLGINDAASESRRLWLLCLLWLGGLLLTASKWEWHLAVYAVPAVGLATLAGVELRRSERPSVLGTSAVLVMLAIAAGMAMTAYGVWNFGDLSRRTWLELSELSTGESSRPYWYLALVGLLVLGVLAEYRRGRWRSVALASMCALILFPLGASVAWLVADATDPGWSWTGANIRQLAGGDNCGVFEGLDIDAGVVPLSRQPSQEERTRLFPEAFPRIERLSTGPLNGQVQTWGTWETGRRLASPDARTGLFESPSFQLEDADEITIWSAFGSADLLSGEVVFTGPSGEETPTQLVNDSEVRWARLHLDVPAGATAVRVDIEDQNADYGGWLAVSSPVMSSDTTHSVLSNSTGFANPLTATQVPCLNLPDLSNGYWDRVDYVASEGTGFDVNALRGLTVTDVACRPDFECLRKIDYPMADVVVTRIR